LVDEAVAVIVDSVARLDVAGVSDPVAIIVRLVRIRNHWAVVETIGHPIAVGIEPLVHQTVAVVVVAVADLRGTWMSGGSGIVAVGADRESVAIAVFVDDAVAVVVLPVADFRLSGGARWVGVVTVASQRRDAVLIAVGLRSRDEEAGFRGHHNLRRTVTAQ